jgi:hypothetical protein
MSAYKFNKNDLVKLFDEEAYLGPKKRGPKKMDVLKCNICNVEKTNAIQFKGRVCYSCYNIWQKMVYKQKYCMWHKLKWQKKKEGKLIDVYENSEGVNI